MDKLAVERRHRLPKQLIVVITGVSSGIGLAQVKAFLEHNHLVIGIDKHSTHSVDHPNFIFKQLDVSDVYAVETLFDWIKNKYNEIHVLCNTAGVLDDFKTIEQIDEKFWNEIIKVNVTSQYLMCQKALPLLLKASASRIINMASIASLTAGGGGLAYTTAKHAVAGLTKQLAYDYANTGLRVNAIAPGAIQTAMTRDDFKGDGQMAQWVASQTPIKRWAQPDEVAELTLFLASDASDYMVGNIIPLDGGWMIR